MLHLIRTAVTIFIMIGLITGVVYPLAATGLAQLFFPWQANGSIITNGGGKAASELIGQPFRSNGYFWGRPSATAPGSYNAASSTGSNLGPSHPALRASVKRRITTLQAAAPENRLPIPVELVTASGSGLDPHISPAAAFYQVKRVAKARGMEEGKVADLIRIHIRDRRFGIFGEPVVSVLRLNMALDAIP